MIFKKPPYRWERVRKIYTDQKQLRETLEEKKLSKIFRKYWADSFGLMYLFDPKYLPEAWYGPPVIFNSCNAIVHKDTYDKELLLQVYEREKKRLEKAPNVTISNIGMGWLRKCSVSPGFAQSIRSRYGLREGSHKDSMVIYDGLVWVFSLEVSGSSIPAVAINWEGDIVDPGRCAFEYPDHRLKFHGLYMPYNLLTWALGPGTEGYSIDLPRKLLSFGKAMKTIREIGNAKRVGRDSRGEIVVLFQDHWLVVSGRGSFYSDKPVEMLPEFADKLLKKVL